jgi:hypothetical protein
LIVGALQQRGASRSFIRRFVKDLAKFARSHAEFKRWNRELDPRETQLLAKIVSPEGHDLVDVILEDMFRAVARHCEIAGEQLQERARFN